MLEQFISWYGNSNSVIFPAISDSIGYLEYTAIMGVFGVLGVLFEAIRNSVKHQSFSISNQYLVGVILLFVFAAALKPTLDFIGWGVRKIDTSSSLSYAERNIMTRAAIERKKAALSNEIDTLLSWNNGKWTPELALKQIALWKRELDLASYLDEGSTGLKNPYFDVEQFNAAESTLQQLLSGFRGLLKVYYVAMMNILYLIIPLAFVFSVFKPSHFLKALGVFLLYGLVLMVINFIEWVIFVIFIDQTVTNNDFGSLVFSTGAILFELLSIFLYLRAMWIARLIVPIPAEDVIGPMVGQAFVATTFLAMRAMKIPVSKPPTGKSGGGKSQGPVDVTTK